MWTLTLGQKLANFRLDTQEWNINYFFFSFFWLQHHLRRWAQSSLPGLSKGKNTPIIPFRRLSNLFNSSTGNFPAKCWFSPPSLSVWRARLSLITSGSLWSEACSSLHTTQRLGWAAKARQGETRGRDLISLEAAHFFVGILLIPGDTLSFSNAAEIKPVTVSRLR